MINNDFTNQLKNYFNRSNKNESGASPADMFKKLKAKRDAIRGVEQPQQETAPAEEKSKSNAADSFTKTKDKTKGKAGEAEANLSPEEKRQQALKKILDKIEAEEAQKYPNRNKNKNTEANQANGATSANPADMKDKPGLEGFLNDLPLFNEFKTSLMDAFKSMDSATAGSISAQYELNYSSMQYIANAAGGYEYQETTLNIKFDLNYIKAGAGGKSGADIAEAIGNATDFESLMNNLEEIGRGMANPQEQTKGIPELKNMKPEDFLSSMQDYFSPEATSGRIVDFATAFFPLSDAFKKGGDTEEARKEFADMMGKAIQKGFDQALGKLGSIPKATKDGIDKTHELTFKGLDDFVKNGMNKQKEQNGVYNSLQELAFSFEMNYSHKSVSVSNYGSNGAQQSKPTASALDTQA